MGGSRQFEEVPWRTPPLGFFLEPRWLLMLRDSSRANYRPCISAFQPFHPRLFSSFQGGIVMLVLSRRPNQRIVIGDNIVVTIVSVSGDRVKLGFQCPSSVPVHREEIYNRIREEMRLDAHDLCEVSAAPGEWL